MPTYFRLIRFLLPALAVASLAVAADADDPVFHAMQDELNRSVNRLVIEKMSRPYFLSYKIEDNDNVRIEARYGALVQSQRERDRYLYIDMRVGDSTLDNTNYVGSWDDVYDMRENVAEENDYDALRHEIWLATDQSYKKALENLARKKAYLQTHPSRDSIADFSSAEQANVMDKPVALSVDAGAWEGTVRTAAEALRSYPSLQDWKVTYTATAVNRRYVNSERGRYLRSGLTQQIEVSATAQASDGQRLTAFRQFITCDDESPPRGDELVADIRKMSEDLSAAAAAPVLDDYSGPVLFSDYAAAQLISQLLVSELTPAREVLTPENWISQYFTAGKLGERVNRRIFPDFVSITDDPKLAEWKGHRLLGHRAADDEGVPARTLALVSEGRLMTLPSTRQPTKKVRESNGHARTLLNQWNVPTVSSLFVKSAKPLASAQLLEKLRTLAKESGNEFGLLITMLENSRIADDYSWMQDAQDKPKLLASPVLMYKVYVKDGRVEPVRGLIFDEVSIRSLKDIVAMGKDEHLCSVLQPTVIPQLEYPASIVTPSILVEEMELKSNPAHEPLPLSANPMFSK
jgi:predicted Zn-dependent protease